MTEIHDRKLKRFKASVNAEIEGQIEQIEQQALEEKAQILKAAEDRILNDSYIRIQKAVKEIEGKYRRMTALHEQELRTEVLKHRNTLVKMIFAFVEQRINGFVNSQEYEKFLVKQIENENTQGAVIKVSEKDLKYKQTLEKASGCKVEADDDIVLGGIALFFEEKGIIIDKTFDNALDEQKQTFSSRYSFRTSEN